MFEKKWTDEQNEKILELHGRIPNGEIAEIFNTTAVNISKRVSYLKKLNKKQEKASKKKQTKSKKQNPKERIKVIKAKSHPEAEDFTKEYKQEFQPINEAPQEEITGEILLECEKPQEETQEEPTGEETENKVNWNGSSNILLSILDSRFKKSEVTPLNDWEKDQFAQSSEACLEQYAGFLSKYSNLISLGLITSEILITRILEFLEKKKSQKKEISESADFKEPTPETPPTKVLSEEEEIAESKRRYNEAIKTQ